MRTKYGTILVAAVVASSGSIFAAATDRELMSDAYWAIWNDAEQSRIDADIEANRKADGMFDLAAPDGAEVKVEQVSHEFRFGAHIFNFNQLGKKEYNDAYKASYGDGGGVKGEPLVSGLFTRNMEKKPAYRALDDLINNEWRTRTTAKVEGDRVSFRGFRGAYRLSWKGADGKSFSKTVYLK